MAYGYKVVMSDYCLYCSIDSPFPQKYKIGKVAKQQKYHGPLAVFTNLKDARVYSTLFEMDDDVVIFRCRYKKSKIKYFFGPVNSPLCNLPNGTDYAETVTLIREITWEED